MEVGEGADGHRGGGADNTVKGVKSKKIKAENRTTTPYMTKYERARVLGTRALQIRYACLSSCHGNRCSGCALDADSVTV